MAQNDFSVGNFHKPSSQQHPSESLGNQSIIHGGRQIGSLEYTPTSNGDLNISVSNTQGKIVFPKL
jgi:hypothetical protein